MNRVDKHLVIVLAIFLAACQSREPIWISADRKVFAGTTLALVVEPYAGTKTQFDEPWTKARSAAAGAATGASGVASECLRDFDAGGNDPVSEVIAGVVILFCLGATAVGGAVGAIAGASGADTASQIEAATQSLQATLASAEPAHDIRVALVEALADKNVTVSEPTEPGTQPMLSVTIETFDLVVFAQQSAAAIVVQIDATIEDKLSSTMAPPLTYGYLAEPIDYIELSQNDAAKARAMIQSTYERVAAMLVQDIVQH